MAHKADTREVNVELADIPGTSLKVSPVAIGTWAIGGWMWGGTDESESVSTIRAALEHGINIFDTAPVYGFGRSEEIVGRAIAEARVRPRVLIATKAGLEWEDGRVFRNASGRGGYSFDLFKVIPQRLSFSQTLRPCQPSATGRVN